MLKYLLIASVLLNLLQLRRLFVIRKMLDRSHKHLADTLGLVAATLVANAKVIRQTSKDYQEFNCVTFWPGFVDQTATWFDQGASLVSGLAIALKKDRQ